jgi:pyridoxamine 5'-phosphate oxidase
MSDTAPPPFRRPPREYGGRALALADLPADPLDLLRAWYDEAHREEPYQPDAMALATAAPDGGPSNRFVLLKAVDERGVVFGTHHPSRKGRELDVNPRAALAVWWPSTERQVRVAGPVERLDATASDALFRARTREAQLSVWASAQSTVLPDHAALEASTEAAVARFTGRDVPRPEWWGGYRVVVEEVEFWQGRPWRLHDRFRYTRDAATGGWRVERLAP